MTTNYVNERRRVFVSLLLFGLFIPTITLADIGSTPAGKTDLQQRLNRVSQDSGYEINPAKTSIEQIVGQAIQALLSLLGTIFLGLVVYGGFVWMQAKGDENEIKRAQGMIKNGIIGMAIIMFAYAIAYFVIIRLESATVLANTSSTP